MTANPLFLTHFLGLTSAELDEIDRLGHALGHKKFDEIQRLTWSDYVAKHEPPYTPGIWRALLDALRDAVHH